MIKTENIDNIDIVTLDTDTLNALVSEQIRQEVSDLFLNGTPKLILDLRGVKYVDSSGFGCLLGITRSAKNNYSVVKFCNIDPEIMKVLKMLHLHTVLNIFPNLEKCISSF
ncbi:MAG: STAS domain-containing protein [Bacteroidales bacterium]